MTEKLILLHSNDIHGKFVGSRKDGKLEGSFAQTAGYVEKVKAENDKVIYCIAGDVFQGSLIDSDFQGLSTMDILNMAPIDLMSLGNHELDYGIGHLMFVDRIADFPIINANFKTKNNNTHLFKPYHRVKFDNMNVLFIGLLTKNIVDQTKAEGLVGTYVTVADCKEEVRRIVDKVRRKEKKVDYTVLLTHIGYEDDLKLAEELDPDLGVDIIVGAHSHTYPDECKVVNNILVVQAGMENTHIGRLDLELNTEENKIENFEWKLIPINEENCPTDKMMKAMISTYVMDIDEKYSQFVTRYSRKIDNYGRRNITELGQLFADAFADSLPVDFFWLASSSTRCYNMDMTVTLQDIREAYPYDNKLYSVKIDGKMMRDMIRHYLRDDVLDNEVETFYQNSSALKIQYSREQHEVTSLEMNGVPVKDDDIFTVGLQEFYMLNCEIGFGISLEELQKYGEAKVISSDGFMVLKNYLSDHEGLGGSLDDRLLIDGCRGNEYLK